MAQTNLTVKMIESLKPGNERVEYWDTAARGLVLRISPNGDKTFSIVYWMGGRKGHRRRFTVGTYPQLSLADARDRAAEAQILVKKGLDPILARKAHEREQAEAEKAALEAQKIAQAEQVRRKYTFSVLAAEYIAQYAKTRKRSWRNDQWYIEQVFEPAFGKRPADEIKRREIIAVLDRLVVEGTPIKANRALACIRKIYNWGVMKEKVFATPCVKIERPANEKSRDKVLTESEIRAFWRATAAEHSNMAATFKLRLLTAQRAGEVMGMRWDEIDGDWWTIPPERTKNKLAHRVPLSTHALKILEEVRKETRLRDENKDRTAVKWVFPNPRRTGPMYECQKAAKRIRESTGLEFRPHDLRRTAASLMTGKGIPRLVVAKILNHIEPGVTTVYDRYSYDAEKRRALEAWGEKVAQIVNQNAA